ncbi:MAG: HypC/HybG/HupF family hydrogenase formation chaperone [Deltaproteobacteria bacterium]|nr:HypC/HybG/HupF family hydrogenase formation chaperone [Deltaproteobacteria bacterium]
MCLAIPGQVVSIEGRTARVAFGGIARDLATDLLPDLAPGDWVLAHAGFAIQRLEEDDAVETLRLFAEIESLGGPVGSE